MKSKRIEELENVDEWIKECDVDGRMISFEFFDSDIEDLKNCIKRDIREERKQAEKEFKELIIEIEESLEFPDVGLLKLKEKIGDLNYNSLNFNFKGSLINDLAS